MIQKSFLFNNVRVKLVPHHGQDTHPGTGIAFYVNNGNGGVIGVRVYPDGRKELCNATPNKQGKKYGHGTETYLQFKHAWKTDENILVSHAVYIAWREEPIPPGMTIDHIDGCSTNNDVRNLRCVSGAINSRDGGFLKKLRNKGINPADVRRSYLLRYFDRMAHIKANISSYRYEHLDRADLMTILFYDIPVVYDHFKKEYNIELPVISNF